MSSNLWPPVVPITIAEQVYQIIRGRIIRGDLEPGAFIREQEISEAIGVSRTPVREALARLFSERFLERIPHRGYKVPDEPWEALLEVYPIIAALEVLAGTLAVGQLDEDDVSQLKKINEELRKAGRRQDVQALVDANNSFHHVLCKRSGNQRLTDLLDQLRAEVVLLDLWYYSIPDHAQLSYSEHKTIITAIENRDFERALSLIERNYARGYQALVEEKDRIGPETSSGKQEGNR